MVQNGGMADALAMLTATGCVTCAVTAVLQLLVCALSKGCSQVGLQEGLLSLPLAQRALMVGKIAPPPD